MRKIIFASHGAFAKGVVESVEMILGKQDNVRAYKLEVSGSASDFADVLEKEIVMNALDEYVIATDLYGASVCNAMYSLTKYENVKLFSGFNLNFALELVIKEDKPLTQEDCEQLVNDAKQGIKNIVNMELNACEEDF